MVSLENLRQEIDLSFDSIHNMKYVQCNTILPVSYFSPVLLLLFLGQNYRESQMMLKELVKHWRCNSRVQSAVKSSQECCMEGFYL